MAEKNADIAEMVREDFRAATENRKEIEDRKLDSYKLYRAWRDDVQGGGRYQGGRGPFGWSKITVPVIYWTTELVLARLGVMPPTVVVTAKNPESVPYAQAKQLRIQHYLKQAAFEEEMLVVLKSMLILGDGIVKVPWDADRRAPGFVAVNWWDWFVSPEAERWHQAEVLYHRTWHTPKDLTRLAEAKDGNGKPLYDLDALQQIMGASNTRSMGDHGWSTRREIQGLGPMRFPSGEEPVSIVEAWYKDGTRVTFGGEELGIILRVVSSEESIHKTPNGQPYRPFSVFQNTPDLHSPYSISDTEMLEGHQAELSTIRNQHVDQATANINAPMGYDARKVRPEAVEDAFGTPGGMFGTDGPPGDVVVRFAPSGSSRDFPEIYDLIRSEAQIVAGVSDFSAGMANSAGLDNTTATGISIVTQEANRRFQQKLKFVELGMRRVAHIYDWLDRALGLEDVFTDPGSDFSMEDGSKGIMMDNGFAQVSGALVNGPDNDFEIEVDAGAMAPPAAGEQARKTMTLLQAIAAMPPEAQMMVDWPGLLRQVVESHGVPADKVLKQQMPMPLGPPIPVDGGAPGEQPVGPPEPVEEAPPASDGARGIPGVPADGAIA